MSRCFACLLLVTIVSLNARAQQPDDVPEKNLLERFEIAEIAVPEGDVSDVVKFLDEMTKLRNDLGAEYRKATAEITKAQQEAAGRILSDAENVSDEHFYAAARYGMASRVAAVASADQEQRRRTYELVKRQLSIGVEQGLNASVLNHAIRLPTYLEQAGDTEMALDACRTFAATIKATENSSYARYVASLEASAKRLEILGSELEIVGNLVDGTDFDWSAYRGKVVLVDFWATWCGPCIQEAPNVKWHYDLYHDRGFEVVAISLDTKKELLETYIQKHEVPWVNLFQDEAGWKHPMAVKYGVRAIPTVFMVDADGKVVSLRARGPELSKQLEKLLGPVTSIARDHAAEGQWDDAAKSMRSLVERSDGKYHYWLGLASAHLMNGDPKAYAETCQDAWPALGKRNKWAKARLVQLCCLSKECGIEGGKVRDLATELRAETDNTTMVLALRMANYRSGEYQACLVESATDGDVLQTAMTYFIKAMASQKLERKEDARQWYRKGTKLVSEAFNDMLGKKHGEHMSDHWVCCSMAQTLQAEAKALVD